MTPSSRIEPAKFKQSIRTQLIFGTIAGLSLALALFGFFVRFVVSTTLLNSVDRELTVRIAQIQHRPPPRHYPMGFQDGPPAPQQQGFGDSGPPFGQPPPPDQGPADNQQGPPPGQGPGFGPGPEDNQQGAPPDQPPPNQHPTLAELLMPHRFTKSGAPLDPRDTATAWDTPALSTAASSNAPVFTFAKSGRLNLRVLTVPIHSPLGDQWFFQTAYPLMEVDSAIEGVDRALLTLIPIALVIAGLGGALLTTGVLNRVGMMVRAAASIGANDLSQRLPVVGNDEFAELALTFNALLSRLQLAFQEQAKIVEQQRRFTADASHELKTPLTVIRGTTSLALAGDGVLDRDATGEIDRAATMMSHLVQDLIFLARADAEQLGRKRIDLLLLEPLQKAVDQIKPISKALIVFNRFDDPVIVNADESEMVRLFSNILENAAHHTPAGGQIKVSVVADPVNATIIIQDTGCGISAEHINHLFERFYRVDMARSRGAEESGGSGLGLAICKGVVDAYGGTISVASQPGKGTTVTIVLPRAH